MFKIKMVVSSGTLYTQYTFDTEKEAKSQIAIFKRIDKKNGGKVKYSVVTA